MSNFFLWFDHTLLKKGEAFTNYGSKFYSVNNLYQGYYSYGSPFKQFVSDFSIAGANILNQVYINGAATNRNNNGFVAINYDMGQVYFSGQVNTSTTTLSGNYSVKDFNVYLTNDIEEKLLFETQFSLNPKVAQNPTGLPPDSLTYPAVFIKNNGGNNEPAALGGLDKTMFNVRAIVLADSQYDLDAVSSIFRDTNKTFIPLIEEGNMPYNSLGDFKNGAAYNFDVLTSGLPETGRIFIDNVFVSKIGGLSFSQKTNLNPNVFSLIIDFELEHFRNPRK
jgi:hypothetical protein